MRDRLFSRLRQPGLDALLSRPDEARHKTPTTFDASRSCGTTSPILRYAWKFGDGKTETPTTPRTHHTYASKGVYTVTLTVTDVAGTSTVQVFTGQTVIRNGGPSASTRKNVTIT